MKTIKDIRVYKSERQNEYGTYITERFADKPLNAKLTRIVMKLRENDFYLEDFDHLYFNFTLCGIENGMKLSDKVDRYHPWYRYCNIQINQDLYAKLGTDTAHKEIISFVEKCLVTYFASVDFDREFIHSCINEAISKGENMLMKFKEKVSAKRKAVLYLRCNDNCKFVPLLQVYDTEGNLLFETDLPEMLTLDTIGEIQLSNKKVTIKPRKNVFSKNLEPMVFEY